jgi:hypothetical protein
MLVALPDSAASARSCARISGLIGISFDTGIPGMGEGGAVDAGGSGRLAWLAGLLPALAAVADGCTGCGGGLEDGAAGGVGSGKDADGGRLLAGIAPFA